MKKQAMPGTRTILLALLGAGLLAGGVRAQGVPDVVKVRTVLAADGAHRGSSLKAAAIVQIDPEYHINDHKPTLDYLIPTELTLKPTGQVNVENIVYPKGELKKFAFSDLRLSVYQGTTVVGALLKVARTARPGTYTLEGKFNYQACNDHACLPPKSVPVTLAVKVVPQSTSLKPVNRDVFDSIKFD
jgi:DsbC/DsbD-like thiol-disulfide interchange protein